MIVGPTSATRLIALLGNPVAHSISPLFQNEAFRHAELDAVYVALRCEEAAVPGLIRGIAGAGGGGNVTVPHKEVAARTVEHRTEAVERTGACNTWWSDGDGVWGDNTDVIGCRRAMQALLSGTARGARVLLLGAGGAARAAMAALEDEGVDEVLVLGRTAERAAALARLFGEAPFSARVARTDEDLPQGGFDLVINTTPLGLHPGDPLPLAEPLFDRVGAALDMAYRPGGTEWVRALRAAGVAAADGSEMLLWQGVAAFERWWRVPAPVEVMRRAIQERVAGEEAQAS